MLENLHSITGKVRPFPADPQVSSIAPLHLALAHEAFTPEGHLQDEEHVLTLTRVLARLAESTLVVEPR